jgi:hypothetical protein
MIRSNAVATTPADNFATQDVSKQILEESLHGTNPTPKCIKLIGDVMAFDANKVKLKSLAKEALWGLQREGDELTKMRTSLTVFSSLICRPSFDDNPGLAWAAAKQTQDQLVGPGD